MAVERGSTNSTVRDVLADVPLWFAGLTAVLPLISALATLRWSNRHVSEMRKLDAVDRERDRAHAVREEVNRELRAERRDLYRRLIVTAKQVLDIDQPMIGKATRALLKLGREQQGLGTPVGDIFEEWAPFDEWRSLLAEAEFMSSTAVVAEVRAIGDRAQSLVQRRTDIRATQAATGELFEFDPDEENAIVYESREAIGRLVNACAADMGARDLGAFTIEHPPRA